MTAAHATSLAALLVRRSGMVVLTPSVAVVQGNALPLR